MGTSYPESRTGWPRGLEGRHVRKEEKGFREGDPECLRQAHQTRKGHGPEDAGAGRPRASRAMLGGDAEALLDAYCLEDVPIGRLDLTPRGHAQRGATPRWPSPKAKRNRRTDRPAESGKRCQTEGGEWPPDLSNTYPPFLQLGKRRPRGPWGPRGRSASRGYGLSAQCVRLRSEINHEWCTRHREPRNKPRPRFQS